MQQIRRVHPKQVTKCRTPEKTATLNEEFLFATTNTEVYLLFVKCHFYSVCLANKTFCGDSLTSLLKTRRLYTPAQTKPEEASFQQTFQVFPSFFSAQNHLSHSFKSGRFFFMCNLKKIHKLCLVKIECPGSEEDYLTALHRLLCFDSK